MNKWTSVSEQNKAMSLKYQANHAPHGKVSHGPLWFYKLGPTEKKKKCLWVLLYFKFEIRRVRTLRNITEVNLH